MQRGQSLKEKFTITSDDFEGLVDAIMAKRRMMQLWQSEELTWPEAVAKYALEQGVSEVHAAERVEDMEVLTGIRLER
jgi:hypothetical protein